MTQPDAREVVNLLAETRMPRKLARVLVLLASRPEATSQEIESETKLRQPEVSTAMKELREHGWVDKRDIKKEGKGRPLHAYRLARPFPQITEEVIEGERDRIREIERIIADLRKHAKAFASP